MKKEMKITFPGQKRVEAHYKGFNISTDQPIIQGGEGTASSPFDLFLTSLGTCAGFYLSIFCQSRKIATDNIFLTLTTESNPEKKMLEKIIIKAHLPSNFPDKYKNAALKAMDGCAVKKLLIDPPEILTVINNS